VDVATEYGLQLEKMGGRWKTYCPFHNDVNTPNLIIYPTTNSYFCFACREGGDVYRFYSLLYNIPISKVLEEHFSLSEQITFMLEDKGNINFKEQVYIIGSNILYELLRKDFEQGWRRMKRFDELLQQQESIPKEKIQECLNLLKEEK
jgi:hypothetical protein